MVPRTLWRQTATCNVMPTASARSPWTEKSRRMDSMEVNKGIAAILIAGILFFLTGLIGDSLVRERLPEKPALAIAAAPAASAGGEAKPAGPAPIEPLLDILYLPSRSRSRLSRPANESKRSDREH